MTRSTTHWDSSNERERPGDKGTDTLHQDSVGNEKKGGEREGVRNSGDRGRDNVGEGETQGRVSGVQSDS